MFRNLLLPLAAIVLLMPLAAGGARPVDQCSRQCTPHSADLNGPGVRRGDEAVWTVLYPHFNPEESQNARINSQSLHHSEADLNRGFNLGPSIVLPNVNGNTTLHMPPYMFVWESTPGFVEFLDGGQRIHQEFGLAQDVHLAGDEMILYFYLSPFNVPNHNDRTSPVDVGVMPRVAIDVRVDMGRHARVKDETIIAELDTGKDGLLGDSRVDMLMNPDGTIPVYEFELHLPLKRHTIEGGYLRGGYVVSIIPYQFRNEDQDVQFSQSDWRIRTGEKYLPRLVVQQQHPLVSKYAWMNIFREKLFVRWSFISVWGTYDVDPDTLRLDVTGPNGPLDSKTIEDVRLKFGVDHDTHFVPANQTWAIPFKKAQLPDGDYVATGRVQNLQGTYELVQEWRFKLENGWPVFDGAEGAPPGRAQTLAAPPPKSGGESPGFEAALLLAVGLIGWPAIRRRP